MTLYLPLHMRSGNILFTLIGSFVFIGCSPTDLRIQRLKDMSVHSLDSIRNDVLLGYNDTVKVDTSVIINKNDTVTLKLRQYCTYDNKINTPVIALMFTNFQNFKHTILYHTLNTKLILKLYIVVL